MGMESKEARYINIILGKYPQMAIYKIECNFFDNSFCDTAVVNDKELFKFSRYDWSVCYLENEINVIGLISKNIAMHLPKVEPMEPGNAKFSHIQGEPLYRNRLLMLDIRMQEVVAEQLALFLKQLHSLPIKESRYKILQECRNSLSGEDWLEKYEELQRKVFPYCDSYTSEYYRQIFRPLLEDENFLNYKPVLIHGELTPKHIKTNSVTNKISGIVDFELAGIGDPAYDVGIILDNLGEGFVRRMAKYYRELQTYIDRARFYAFTDSLLWACSVSDMLATRDFSKFRLVAKDRDIMPIGSKW